MAAKKKVGAHVIKGDPVEKLSSEGPLDQNLGISVDENMTDQVFLGSVTDENDMFKRCPATGTVDFAKKMGGKSLKEILEGFDYLTENVFMNPTGEGFSHYNDVSFDKYAVTDAKWMDDPEELIWKTPLLAQLQAKLNAVTHFLSDPSAVDFEGSMSDEEKQVVAQRARELAASLQDEALNQINAETEGGETQLSESIMATKDRFMEYTVTTEEAKQEGGLTEDEVNELFRGGE
jgi:hypothetical protein